MEAESGEDIVPDSRIFRVLSIQSCFLSTFLTGPKVKHFPLYTIHSISFVNFASLYLPQAAMQIQTTHAILIAATLDSDTKTFIPIP